MAIVCFQEGFGDKKPTLFVFLLPCPPREHRYLEMFFQPEIEERRREYVRRELSTLCVHKVEEWVSSAGLYNYIGSLYPKYLLFSRLAASEVCSVVKRVRNTQLFH